MEPPDLNSPADDRRLSELLRSTAPISDDGFSHRVLAALPPPAAAPRWVPLAAVLTGGVAGLAYAWWRGATAAEVEATARALDGLLRQCAPLLDNAWLWVAAAIVAGSCYSALRLSGLARSPLRR